MMVVDHVNVKGAIEAFLVWTGLLLDGLHICGWVDIDAVFSEESECRHAHFVEWHGGVEPHWTLNDRIDEAE